MNLAMLLEMAAEGAGDRVAVGSRRDGWTYGELLARTRSTADWLADRPGESVSLLDRNSEAVPLLLFAAGMVARPFAPLNYRLAADQLREILDRVAPAVLVRSDDLPVPAGVTGHLEAVSRAECIERSTRSTSPATWTGDGDDVAVLLFTSGTSGAPKAAVLRHRHLVAYVISTVEFLGASPDEAALISVPPYHVAGISAVLTSVYAGRRMVQLESFDPAQWVEVAHRERVTHAMVVPTMLGRILAVIERSGTGLPSLRHLSYGGGHMPVPTIERALRLLPGVDFVNAYGLTETSSTIAVLDPGEHRLAIASDAPEVRARLGSVGRPLASLDVEIRDPSGAAVPTGSSGEIHVRGEQVSGEYLGGHGLDAEGWFATRDGGHLDEDGYLFVEGRLDDVIVRGGENLSPGEIEEVLLMHPSVAEAGVIGLPDAEWGEQVVAAVVVADDGGVGADELRAWVRSHLRSSRVPTRVVFMDELPYNDTGKLLRRVLRAELGSSPSPA